MSSDSAVTQPNDSKEANGSKDTPVGASLADIHFDFDAIFANNLKEVGIPTLLKPGQKVPKDEFDELQEFLEEGNRMADALDGRLDNFTAMLRKVIQQQAEQNTTTQPTTSNK